MPPVGVGDRQEQDSADQEPERRAARAAAREPVVHQNDPADADHRAEAEGEVLRPRQRADEVGVGLRHRGSRDSLSPRCSPAARKKLRLSRRTKPFQESVIREMTRLGAEVGGVNLAQGLPDFDPPAGARRGAAPGRRRGPPPVHLSRGATRASAQALAEKHRRFNAMRGRSGKRGDGHLRRLRSRGRGGPRADRAGRRGRDPRALVRELPAGLRARGRHAAVRADARARLRDRLRRGSRARSTGARDCCS